MFRCLAVLIAVCGVAACAQPAPDAAATPGFVTAVDQAPVTASLPTTEPDQWLLAHLDVETTGLVPGYHEMIDAGFVITDLEGNVVDQLFVRIQPEHPERLSPGAAKVNGFDAAKWREQEALSTHDAVAAIFAFHQRVAAKKHVLLVTFNSQFDTAFLDALLRRENRTWREMYHYFVLDVPSMAWSLGLRDLTNGALAKRLGVADEPRVADEHTGITGAMLNVRIYQGLRKLQPAGK